MLIKNAFVYNTDKRIFEKKDLRITGQYITEISDHIITDDMVIEAEGEYLLPGLIDVHTHGRGGYDFCGVPAEKLSEMAEGYAKHGVTSVMPTLASDEFEKMLLAAKSINEFKPTKKSADLFGVHIEGRFLNPKKKGAHAERFLAPLDPRDLDAEVFRMCRRLHISAAYELDRDKSFMKKALSMGATLGLGHTMATYAEAKEIEASGLTSYTHLYNAMTPLHHRDGGAVGAALSGDSYAELIVDGFHISPEVVALTQKIKGCERISLISDSMNATDMPDGSYSIAGLDVTVKDGHALAEGGVIAGSTLTLERAVNNMIDFCGIPLTEAIISATETPAKMIGAYDMCGSLEAGKKADILFSSTPERLDIKKIMVRGSFID